MEDKNKEEELPKNEDEETTEEQTQQAEGEQVAEEAKETKKEKTVEEQLEEEKNKFIRLFAEFENYKKRTSKERIELFKTAGQEVIQTMLPVLDDFDRAIQQLQQLENDEFLKGVQLIQGKFSEALKSKGLEVVAVKAGDDFDSEIHEAITQIPAPSPEQKGKIIDVVEKGYCLGDKTIRFPKVVIGN